MMQYFFYVFMTQYIFISQTFLFVRFLLLYTLDRNWGPFQKNIIYSSNVSGKGKKFLKKGKIREFHVEKNVGTLLSE